MRLLFLVAVLALMGMLKACGDSNCSNNCQSCSSVNWCTNCCSNFGFNSYWDNRNVTTNGSTSTQYISVRECRRCSDLICNYCSFPSGVQECISCPQNYGTLVLYKHYCSLCSSSNAQACASINNCSSVDPNDWQDGCANCPYFAFIAPDKCMSCSQVFRNCLKCNSSSCYDCNNYYYLNTTNNKECVSCTFLNCQHCTHGPVCWYCIAGFYLDNNRVCQRCPIPCNTCSSSTQCDSCIGQTYLLKNGICEPCLNINETLNCITCGLTFSSALNATVQYCYSCLNTTYLDNGNCTACVSPCATCFSSIDCTSCINDTYYLDTSGFNDVCSACSSSITNCKTCFTNSICSTCEDGYNIIFRPNACTKCSDAFQFCDNCTMTQCMDCLPGYIMNVVTLRCDMNLNCGSNCTSCESGYPNNCVTCPSGYYVSSKVCLPCLAICMTCSSGTDCLLCHFGYYYTNNTCLACPNRTYYLDTLKDCINCSAYCNACTVLGCDSCDPLFSISEYNHRCIDTCGDGYIVTLPCDATIGIANDGCTDTCQIQHNYNCTYVNQTNSVANSNVTTVQVSTCSYIGDISISISKASQALFANQVQLTFKISPYLYGMPDGSEYQAYLRTIFDLAPFKDFTISINPSNEQVTFTIPYETDISTLAMSLSVNYQNLTANPMFQYTTNKAKSLKMNEILTNGRLGEYYQASQYSLNKSIYIYCFAIVILSYLLFLVGLVSRQLAALENMILYQTIFLLVVFRQGPCNFYLEGLIALRYSTGFDFSGKSTAQISNTKFYNYGINTQSLLYQYNMHFFILFVPIILSFFFMLYRIKNKHLPVKHDFGRSVAEELIGYTLLYIITFNFYGLFTYTYMYMQSEKVDEFQNFTVLGASLLLTIFSWFNLIFRPEAVGSFRSAFGSYKNAYFVEQSKVECVRKIEGFFKWRIKSEEWKEKYHKFTTNFFFFLLAYQITAAFCIISSLHVVLLAMQIFIFVLLFMTKPYLKVVENARSLLLFLTLILSNFMNFTTPKGYMLTLTLSVLMLFHLALTIFTTVKFAKFEILKQCNQRSKVVREIFKENENIPKAELNAHHKEVINELIEKYHQLGIQQKLQAYSPSKSMKISDKPEKILRQVQKKEKRQQKKQPSVKDEVSQQEHMYTEQRILAEQNQHLRFLQGMQFYCKYGNELDNQLVKQHYSQV